MTANDNKKLDRGISDPYNLTDSELKKFVELIYNECGISLSSAKNSMLSSRLAKRLRALSIDTYNEYYKHVIDTLGKNDELIHLIDVVTTNTTNFFRENNHFEFLTKQLLPNRVDSNRPMRIWSAGCSSGEEPYTISMVMSDYFERYHGEYEILATDISTRVLQKAKQAVYNSESVEIVPQSFKRKYLMRGKGAQEGHWRVVPELRKKINFQKQNFMDDRYAIDGKFDIIFCRNVIIYFDWETKAKIINRFCDYLVPGGYLFIGHSETLNGMNDQLRPVEPTVYQKPELQTGMARRRAA